MRTSIPAASDSQPPSNGSLAGQSLIHLRLNRLLSVRGPTMSNKPHQHPRKQKWHARPATRLLVAILLIALFLLGLALSASGHPVLLR